MELYVALIVFTLLLCMYFSINSWYNHKFSYWSSRGVFGPKPKLIIGNLENVLTRKSQFFGFFVENYFKYKYLPYVGLYSFHKPVLVINDLDLAKDIMTKDFNHFEAHGIFSGGEADPLAGHLFNMHGEKWKKLRAKITPSFSSGKLKAMFPLIKKVAKECTNYVSIKSTMSKSMDFSELYARYAIDVIGSIGFGLECNSFKRPDSEFRLKGQEYFSPKNLYWVMVRAFAFFTPDLFSKFKISRINPAIIKFFYDLVETTVKLREKHNFYRNDFLQMLIEIRRNRSCNEGKLSDEVKPGSGDVQLTMTDVVANTMLLLFAGYETTATTSYFLSYELAADPRLQRRARDEVLAVLKRHGDSCSYEALQEMEFLTMAIKETLRKHPPLRSLFRKCTRDYKVPGTDLVIEKGTLVFLPIQGYQMDPDIYPEPEKFNPERFLPENRGNSHLCSWMPFGEGPRICLGMRLAFIQVKTALVSILANYSLEVDSRTKVPVRYCNKSLAAAADGGMWLKLKELDDDANEEINAKSYSGISVNHTILEFHKKRADTERVF